MSDYERQKWDRRWAELDPDIVHEPTSTLAILALVINGGEAMDLACGDGRNSIYLAQNGFRVHALDISSKALDREGSHVFAPQVAVTAGMSWLTRASASSSPSQSTTASLMN